MTSPHYSLLVTETERRLSPPPSPQIFKYVLALFWNKSGLFSCPYRILDYFSDILFTFSTTFILITKLKSLSVLYLSFCQSVSPSVRLSVCSVFLTSSWHSEQLLFWWVSWKIFLSFFLFFCLSVCLAVCRSLCLSFWHVDILSNFCFDKSWCQHRGNCLFLGLLSDALNYRNMKNVPGLYHFDFHMCGN